MNMRFRNLIASGFVAGSLGMALPAIAQDGAYGGGGAAQQQQGADFSADQLDAYKEAQSRVAEIGEKWTSRMQGAENPDEMQKARESAQKEMVIAVENAGLTVQEYNQITQAAQTDPELQEELSN